MFLLSFLFIWLSLFDVSNGDEDIAALAGTQWRLVQCTYDNKLRPVNHRATLEFTEDMLQMYGNDGCSDVICKISVGGNKLTVSSITSPWKKSCIGKEKLTVAKNFVATLRGHTAYKVSGNYLMFYSGSTARLVFAKIISNGEESTIIKRSYKVDAIYYNKDGKKYMKLYDFVTQSHIYLEKIKGFTFVPGYKYNIEMKTTIIADGPRAKTSYELLKVVSKVRK